MSADSILQNAIDDVAEFGWHCLSVGSDGTAPNFSYSVGWPESLQAPECIVFGLPAKLQHSMLWEIYRQVQAGLTLVDGERISNVLQGYDCIARKVHDSQIDGHLVLAQRYARHSGASDVSAFQIFWPGVNDGLFPWEADCHHEVRERQPLLYLPLTGGSV